MLNYEIAGNGTETLVLLHGLMEDLSVWDEMQEYLTEKFRLIKVDLPGYGKSAFDAEIFTMEMMAEQVAAVTQHLQLENFHMLGHSMGGYVGLAFAEKFAGNLKSLTLFFSTYLPDTEEKKQTRRKSFRIVQEEYAKFVNAGVPLNFNANELDSLKDKVALAKQIALRQPNSSALASLKGMIERPDRLAVINNFAGTVLVLCGNHDNAIDSAGTLSGLPDRPNMKSYLLNCGHNGQWEKPAVCAEILNEELLNP